MQIDRQIYGVIVTIIGAICWGFSGACGQYLFTHKGIGSDFLVTVRLFSAGSVMLIFCLARYGKSVFSVFSSARDTARLLIFGLIGLSLCQYSYFTSIQYSNAGVSTTIQYTAPAFLLLVVCIMEKRRPSPVELVALALAMLGVFIIATHGSLDSLVLPAKAVFWAFLSVIGVIVYSLSPKFMSRKYPLSLNLALGMTIGGVVLGLLVRVWTLPGIHDTSGALAMASIVFIGTIAAFSLYLTGAGIIGPAKASLIACIEPVAATLFAALWLDTHIAPLDYIGLALILLCIVLLRKG